MKKVLFFSVALLVLILAGCATIPTVGDANLKVYLTDKPLQDIDSLWINVGNVSYHYDLGDGDGVWAEATVTNNVFDLLTLVGTEVEFFDIVVPEGATLTQIKMEVVAATVTTLGQDFGVTIPSSEIKIPMKSIVRDGDEIVLDFDVTRSLKLTGNNNYILKPVLIPFHRERHEYQHRYEIEGEVFVNGEGFEKALVVLLPDDEATVLRLTLTNKDGEFCLGKWEEATYTLNVYLNFNIFAENEEFGLPATPDYSTKVSLNGDLNLNISISQ